MAIRFYEQEVKSGLKDKRRLSAYLTALVHTHLEHGGKPGLTYIFCSDAQLLEINRQFLNHDTYTDIITFDLTADDGPLEGEIYISTERVAENAEKFKAEYERELHRVIFHGALHLCGYKDKKPADKQKMREMEDQCLREYFN